MSDDLTKFPGSTLDGGINVFTPDFTADLQLDLETYNVTQGIHQGMGPRYGMSPIPGHSDQVTLAFGSVRLPGMANSESAVAVGGTPQLLSRTKLYGVIPMKFWDNSAAQQTDGYLWIGLCGANTLFAVPSSIYGGGAASFPTGNIYDGVFAQATSFYRELVLPANAPGIPVTVSSAINYASFALVQAQGPQVPTKWLIGQTTAVGDATHAPSSNLWSLENSVTGFGARVYAGVPSDFCLQAYKPKARNIKVYALTSDGHKNIDYSVSSFTPSSSTYVRSNAFLLGTPQINLAATTATKDTAGTTYSSSKLALYNDEDLVTQSSYAALAIAIEGKAYLGIMQTYVCGAEGDSLQWCDLVNDPIKPLSTNTYTENTVVRPSPFVSWPQFARGSASTGGNWVAGAANSGILRANTIYEFAYSIYNKRINYESNVSNAVKYETGVTDFISLNNSPITPGESFIVQYGSGTGMPLPITSPTSNKYLPFNMFEYRFYYRLEGAGDWLPAARIDAAQYWFYNNLGSLVLCGSAIGALPGGSPGAFVDYSPLPNDTWDCVVSFKNRFFWSSKTQVCFSLQNNALAYPGRNSFPAVTGEYRGMTIHAFPGQSTQEARCLIWGSKEAYVGRFTGDKAVASVALSPSTTGEFPVDGSDFLIDFWTSVTSFSHRSAVVADGQLYYWGPQGIRHDNGTEFPDRVSQGLEPDLFTLYDPSRTTEIFGVYTEQTQEISWFYPPKVADGFATHALTLNLRTGSFTRQKFVPKIDAAQKLQLKSNVGPAGDRTMVVVRDSDASVIQRPYFWDHRNASGDRKPSADFLVKSWTSPTTYTRRLVFTQNITGLIAVGDLLALDQAGDYCLKSSPTPVTACDDMLTKVTALISSTSVDVQIPTNATMDATGTLYYYNYLPVWHSTATGTGLNGFNWQILTGYWGPGGVQFHGIWLYLYFMLKMSLVKSVVKQYFAIAHRTMTSGSIELASKNVQFVDNSDGNMQLYHPLELAEGNMNGQGIKFRLSGTQIASSWVLQYVEPHANVEDGNVMKQFEG